MLPLFFVIFSIFLGVAFPELLLTLLGEADDWLFLWTLLLALLYLFNSVYIVQPSERRLLVNRRSGQPIVLEPGTHFLPNPLLKELKPAGSNWRKFGYLPQPGTRLHMDPQATQTHTADGIAATVDVSLEAQVREWSAEGLLRDRACIWSRSCMIINQWLSEILATIAADECTYGHLSQVLNTTANIDALNAVLASEFTHLAAKRLILDPNGIKLAPAWIEQRDKIQQERQLLAEREKVLDKERLIGRMERVKATEALEHELGLERQRLSQRLEQGKLELAAELEAGRSRAEAELEQARATAEHEHAAEASRMERLTAQGLSHDQFVRLEGARILLSAMAGSSGTNYLAVPPGLLGLGAAGLTADEHKQAYAMC